jgi:glycosyltransferase involved in cell wall biosynthesis
VARRMERIVTVSDSSAKDTARHFRLRRGRVRIVHNGIDIDKFRRVDVRKEPNSLIIVGKVEDKKKGVPDLFKAVQLLKGDIDVRVCVVGSQGADDCGIRLAEQLGIADRVTFTGHVTTDELVRLYSSAEIAVTASLYEGFGLPAAEAMACGTPVVATRAGALPEIVGGDGTGILVPPADPPALAAAIRHLLSDAGLRQKMGQAARERIERCFSWEVAARKTADVYEELL